MKEHREAMVHHQMRGKGCELIKIMSLKMDTIKFRDSVIKTGVGYMK